MDYNLKFWKPKGFHNNFMAAGDMSFGFFLDWEYFALSFLKTDQVSKSGNVFSSMRLITILNLIFS